MRRGLLIVDTAGMSWTIFFSVVRHRAQEGRGGGWGGWGWGGAGEVHVRGGGGGGNFRLCYPTALQTSLFLVSSCINVLLQLVHGQGGIGARVLSCRSFIIECCEVLVGVVHM